MFPQYEWTANVVYAILWSRDRQVEPPCRLHLDESLVVVVTWYFAASSRVLVQVVLVSSLHRWFLLRLWFLVLSTMAC